MTDQQLPAESNPEYRQHRSSVIALAALVIVVAAGAGWYYVSHSMPGTPEQQLEGIIQSDAQNKQDQLESIVNASSTGALHDQATVALGSLLLSSTSTAPQGAAMLRELSISPQANVAYRSAAAFQLALAARYLGDSFAISDVFTGPTWSGFLSATSTTTADPVEQASVNAMLWASNLHSTSAIEYTLAEWYATALFTLSNPSEEKSYLANAQARLALGDDDFQQEQAARTDPEGLAVNVNTSFGYSESYRARSLGDLYLYYTFANLPQTIALADVQSAYTNSIATLEADPSNVSNISLALTTRLFYAQFLSAAGGATYAADISQILGPLVSDQYPAPQQSVDAQLSALGADVSNPLRQSIVALAKVDPSFQSYLESLGWQSSAFGAQ